MSIASIVRLGFGDSPSIATYGFGIGSVTPSTLSGFKLDDILFPQVAGAFFDIDDILFPVPTGGAVGSYYYRFLAGGPS